MSTMKCQICIGLLRGDDTDVVECGDCGCKAHIGCDQRAQDYICAMESASRFQRAQVIKVSTDGDSKPLSNLRDPDLTYMLLSRYLGLISIHAQPVRVRDREISEMLKMIDSYSVISPSGD
jgi:hypothetical protein